MRNVTDDRMHVWAAEPLPDAVTRSLQQLAHAQGVRHVAVMPDVHLAGSVCNGTVVATDNQLYPAAVGSDIGCGMTAVALVAPPDFWDQSGPAQRLLAALHRIVPVLRHSRATAPLSIPQSLLESPLSDRRLEKLKGRDARVQMGTLGRGNHFLEIQRDQTGRLWLLVHSGSRAVGQAITTHHLQLAAAGQGLVALPADSNRGRQYLQDAAWACRYASANRQALLAAVELALHTLFDVKVDWATQFESDHNHLRRESHFGQHWYVHRKGAQSAQHGQWGIIPGSMGTSTFHVQGRGHPLALSSSSHGAGRRLSRRAARQAVTRHQLTRQLRRVWFDQQCADALRDEAPAAYKDIHAVMRAQRDLVSIVRQLEPVLVYKR